MLFTRWPALVALALVLAVSAQAVTTVSDCGQAIDVAGETYELNQSISTAGNNCLGILAENVTLDCKGYTVSGNSVIINISSANATVKGCVINDSDDTISAAGIEFVSGGSAQITNNIFHHLYNGIECPYYNSCFNSTIFNNTFYDAEGSGIAVTQCANDYLNISSNSMRNVSGAGIELQCAGNHSTVYFNSINWTGGSGIAVSGPKWCSIVGNNVTSPDRNGNEHSGIHLSSTENCGISSNTVYNDTTTGAAGIEVENSYNATVSDNNASYNYKGFSMTGSSKLRLRDNTADGNTHLGYYLEYWSSSYGDPADHDIDTSNTANGESIHYYFNVSDTVIEGLTLTAPNTMNGKISCINCTNVTIRNNVIANNIGDPGSSDWVAGTGFGTGSSDSLIYNNTFQNISKAVVLFNYPQNINVTGNTFYGNIYGVMPYGTTNVIISENNFTSNTVAAISIANWAFWTNSGTLLSKNYGSGNAKWVDFLADSATWTVYDDGVALTYGVESTDPVEPNIYLGNGVAAVNASANSALNTSADVTIIFSGTCPRVNLYYYGNYSTSLTEIMGGGQLCNSTSTPACTVTSCSGNMVTFSVDHFDSYGGQGYDIPEFSEVAALAALLLAAGGFALARKRK